MFYIQLFSRIVTISCKSFYFHLLVCIRVRRSEVEEGEINEEEAAARGSAATNNEVTDMDVDMPNADQS